MGNRSSYVTENSTNLPVRMGLCAGSVHNREILFTFSLVSSCSTVHMKNSIPFHQLQIEVHLQTFQMAFHDYDAPHYNTNH